MKVKEIMSKGDFKTCSPETRITTVARIMKETNKGALPVVDRNARVVGIITDRDVCLSIGENGHNAASMRVTDALPGAKVRAVTPDDDIGSALKQMRRYKVGRLPVLDEQGKLKGMLSVNNILSRAVAKGEAIGALKSKNENLAKTIHSLFDRNNRAAEARRPGRRSTAAGKAARKTTPARRRKT